MTFDESLHDVMIRERQLEAHILRSPEYLRRADLELKRQVSMLYLAIALLLLFQGLFTVHAMDRLPLASILLTGVTSFLAIVNCLLLIRTKMWLRRLNEEWLNPQEKVAVDSLKHQRHEILTRIPRGVSGRDGAQLN
jgi:hypothetical protein